MPRADRPLSRPHAAAQVVLAAVCAPLLALVLAGARSPVAQAGPPSVCNVETNERIVAVGDVHGAYDRFVAILRTAGLLDARDRWIGGRAVLVQTGDVLDRGADSRRALDLLRRLERDAARAGGRVFALLGNHEVMRMLGVWRDVSAGEYEAFRNADSVDLRERFYEAASENAVQRAKRDGTKYNDVAFRDQFLKETPLGFIEMIRAFDPSGEYGRWLRTHDAIVRINGIMFLHGGVAPATASMGCEGINAAIRRDITSGRPSQETMRSMFSSSDKGPLWYRGLAEEPEAAFAPTLTAILGQLGARAIVVGHTVALGRMATRFGGRVVQIDTGMLGGNFYPGGAASALEISGETAATAIYADRREPLPQLPARETPAVAR